MFCHAITLWHKLQQIVCMSHTHLIVLMGGMEVKILYPNEMSPDPANILYATVYNTIITPEISA